MNTETKRQFQNTIQDLLNLEISTILKASITGRKMPPVPEALEDISRKYNFKLVDSGAKFKLAAGAAWGSRSAFEQIGKAVRQEREKLKDISSASGGLSSQQEEDYWMFIRIEKISASLVQLFSTETDVAGTAENLVFIRKAWELGVEEIAMKTVIQLDGDVITRIKERFAEKQHATLHNLHEKGISTALQYWKTLVDVAKTIFKSWAT